MATETKAWRAEDSTLHETEREATKANVLHLVKTRFGNDPECPSETDISNWLIEKREDIIRVLTGYHRAAPTATAAKATEPEPIPAGVVYNPEAGNFYDTAASKGMGNAFHRKWFLRREEFPQRT